MRSRTTKGARPSRSPASRASAASASPRTPRLNERIQVTDTISYLGGSHRVKAGFDFNYINTKDTALPLHFGGRYIFQSLPGSVLAAVGLPPRATPLSALEALRLGLPAAYVQGYGVTGESYKDQDLSVFLQDDWRISSHLTLKAGIRYQRQRPYDDFDYTVSDLGGAKLTYKYPADNNNFAPRIAIAYDPSGSGKTSLHAGYGIFFDNQIIAIGQIGNGIDGSADGVRTLVARFPASLAPWRAPGHRIPEPTSAYPSLIIAPDPGLETPYSHQAAVGIDQTLRQRLLRGRQLRLRARQAPAGHDRLQPRDPRPRRGTTSERRPRRALDLGFPPAIHRVRGDVVPRVSR